MKKLKLVSMILSCTLLMASFTACTAEPIEITSENAKDLVDLEGYKHDFLATSGFDIEGVDYEAEVETFDTI